MSRSHVEKEEWLCSECDARHSVDTVDTDGMKCSKCGEQSGTLASCDSCGIYHDGGEVSCGPCMETKLAKF